MWQAARKSKRVEKITTMDVFYTAINSMTKKRENVSSKRCKKKEKMMSKRENVSAKRQETA